MVIRGTSVRQNQTRVSGFVHEILANELFWSLSRAESHPTGRWSEDECCVAQAGVCVFMLLKGVFRSATFERQ